MGKQHRGGQLVQTFARREKGTAVHVTARQVTLKDGTSGTVHGINLSEAEVPDRSYVAETCGAIYENNTVKLMFAQPKLGGGLRSLVIISMTPLAAAQFLHAVEHLQNVSLDEIATKSNIIKEPLSDFPATEPEQTAGLAANMVAAAFSGRETCMDFYHANAFTVAALPATSKLHLEPVVRINTRTSLMLALVHRLQELRSEFPADAAIWGNINE
jgi:hypothetical protein